jgi:Na+/proline symporter
MFIGHFGLAFAAKPAARAVSLGTLFLACQFADLLWPMLVLGGVERFAIDPGNTAFTPIDFQHYPYSHSLLTLAGWGVLVAVLYRVLSGRAWRAAAIVGAVVWSHWWLDFVTHGPDLPISPGGHTRVGLGLWNSVPATLVVETLLFAIGVLVYTRSTRPLDRAGSIGLWSLVVVLLGINVANAMSPPPPGVTPVAIVALAMWLLVAWGYYIDRHRRSNPGPDRPST